jgi:hypothetical protein
VNLKLLCLFDSSLTVQQTNIVEGVLLNWSLSLFLVF